MRYENYQAIKVERRDQVVYLTLNRPDKMNAVDEQMHEELASIFLDVAADPDCEAVVLTGEGRAFSAGGDIDWMQKMIDDPANFEKTGFEAKRIIYSMLDCEKPMIAKINGHAAGLGATIALFCDVIFMSEDARIGDPHVSVGLVAGDGGAIIWPQLVGYARAKEFLMTGEMLTASRAADMGLVNYAVPAEELDARVDQFVGQLMSGARKAIRWTKASVNIGLKQLAHSIMDACISMEAQSNRTADHQEAVNAFREKRRPVFTGK